MKDVSQQKAYSIVAAAKAYDVSPDFIRRAINAGTLRSKRTGQLEDGTPTGKHVIKAEWLDDWFEGLADA